MEFLFMEFDIEMMKNDHFYESALDRLIIKSNEIVQLKNNGFLTESEDEDSLFEEAGQNFIDSLKKFFKNIIDNIINLVKKVQESIKAKMVEKEINKKLKYLKAQLATNKAELSTKKIKYFDTARYMKEYTKFINFAVSGIKKVYGKEYSSVEEYEKAYKKYSDDLTNMYDKLKLSGEEAWIISTNIDACLKYTEKEVSSQQSVIKLYEEQWKKAIEEMEKLAEKEDDVSKVNDIKHESTKLTSKLSAGFKKIANSSFIKVSALVAVVGSSIAAHNIAKNSNNKSQHNHDTAMHMQIHNDNMNMADQAHRTATEMHMQAHEIATQMHNNFMNGF